MSDLDWSKIGCGKDLWAKVCRSVRKHLFDDNMFVIKNLTKCSAVNLLDCFTQNTSDTVKTNTKFFLIGHVSGQLKMDGTRPGTILSRFLRMCAHPIKTPDMQPTYEFTSSTNDDKGTRSVRVELTGLKKYEVNWKLLQPSQLVLDPKCDGANGPRRTIYIITEVVFAEKMLVEYVDVDGTSKQQCLEERFPLAFAYDQFTVNQSGVLGPPHKRNIHLEATFGKL